MDVVQQFCLRWNNYQSTLHHVFHKLWVNKVFVDVSIVVEGRQIDCHKVILSACSTYFEQLLSEHSSHPHPLILLHDIPYSAVEALVAFMYKGEINVNQDQLSAILKVADSLKIKGLADSDAISNFTKYRLLSPDITKVTSSHYAQPLPSKPTQVPSLAACDTTSAARNYTTTLVKAQAPTPAISTIRKSEYLPAMYAQKKRPRLEEPVENLPPSPPISLGELYGNDQARSSPLDSGSVYEIKREQDDESDLELQIDETAAPNSPSDHTGSDTMSNRNTPILDAESQELAVKHETAQSLAALACQGAINLVTHGSFSPQVPLAPKAAPLKVKDEKPPVSGSGTKSGGKNFDRPYTLKDLEDGIESVLEGRLTPAKAIAKYKVPRRTFFRRLSAVRKSRGIPSAKENSADLLNAACVKLPPTQSELRGSGAPVLPSNLTSTGNFAPQKPAKQLDSIMKENKAQALNLNNGNVFSLLNVAANPNYEYYIKYLKFSQNKDRLSVSDDLKDPKVDGNRNLTTQSVTEQKLSLVQQNGNLV